MVGVLKLLIGAGIIHALCYIAAVIGKCYVATISKNLDAEKVEPLAKMMSKDININLRK